MKMFFQNFEPTFKFLNLCVLASAAFIGPALVGEGGALGEGSRELRDSDCEQAHD